MGRLIITFLVFMCGYLFKSNEQQVARYSKITFLHMVEQIKEGFKEADEGKQKVSAPEVHTENHGPDEVKRITRIVEG